MSLVHRYKQNKYDRNSLKKQDNVLLSQVYFTLEFGKTQHQDLLLGMEIITLDNFAL
jgi:hypothetical protein